jgi:TatD DNase family protein
LKKPCRKIRINMQFFDSHCHFDFEIFDKDRDLIWRECDALGITHLIIPGVAPEQWSTAAGIAQPYRNIYWGAGLHPWWINQESIKSDNIKKDIAENDIELFLKSLHQQLQKNTKQQKCIAIGECGLDTTIETPIALQQQVLDIHLQLAQQVSLPLIIHCRNIHNELLQQLKAYNLTSGGVIHGFSGSYELAASYWNMGFRLGIGGTITYERANKTRTAVKKLPLDAILLETDAPDMPLSGQQGERNSPANIIAIAQALADLRGESLEKIAAQTTYNSCTLFKIKP